MSHPGRRRRRRRHLFPARGNSEPGRAGRRSRRHHRRRPLSRIRRGIAGFGAADAQARLWRRAPGRRRSRNRGSMSRSMSDLDEAAMLFHQRHGRSLRVATKFSRLTRAFFAEQRHRRVFAGRVVRRHRRRTGCRRGGFRGRSHLDRHHACGKPSQGNRRRHRPANRGLPDRVAAQRAMERSGASPRSSTWSSRSRRACAPPRSSCFAFRFRRTAADAQAATHRKIRLRAQLLGRQRGFAAGRRAAPSWSPIANAQSSTAS